LPGGLLAEIDPRRLLDGVFQFFAGFELDHIFGFDLDRFTGLGIPAFAGFLTGFAEGAEPDQRHFAVLFLQGFGDVGHE
jgi:hydrogenase/urease accessory protein HupE